jgi:hypothetical protein
MFGQAGYKHPAALRPDPQLKQHTVTPVPVADSSNYRPGILGDLFPMWM